ncbi:MAG: histidine--tRNA ligase [Alphaproteobacteria bacterium]|jgi:histidyl-tRNA synthetase|nr:histidine--tRNA ligase [Alphaproteobacteria bacterium]MBT5798597.1 histidine--tRNA ligase [Alphaproteobacteria bacterium]MDC3311430.1 histidine--tRNA ligase [Alphaproteobacteria bacterium]
MKPMQPVRGTSDLMPKQKSQMNAVVETATLIANRYGFQDMETPIFEFTEVFSRPLGASSDVVAKETYSFEDRGGTSLTLRPEGTASVMRALISNGLTQSLPQKFFYAGPMFRYERPQKGRMRLFHQFGCEFIGSYNPLADAEIIGCAAMILSDLGVLDKCVLHLNSLGDTKSRDDYRHALITYLSDYKHLLSQDSKRRLDENPLRILDSKAVEDQQIVENAPRLPEFLTPQATEHFDQLTAALDTAEIDWHLDPTLVRGLDYYSHTAFEFITQALGSQGTVLGGGRYDGLSATLGGPDIGAVGFAAGIERLALLVDQTDEFIYDVGVILADDSASSVGFAFANKLRSCGLKVDIPLAGQVGKKLKRAALVGCSLCIIIGETEIKTDTIQVKIMATGEQKQLTQIEVVEFAQKFFEQKQESI